MSSHFPLYLFEYRTFYGKNKQKIQYRKEKQRKYWDLQDLSQIMCSI